MKKLLGLLLVLLLLCSPFILLCSSCTSAEIDLSEYSSGELRQLIVAAQKEVASRFAELGPSIAEKFVEIMNDNGYHIEIGDESNNYFEFIDRNNPSFSMTLTYNVGCTGKITGDISPEYAQTCFTTLALGLLKPKAIPKFAN